MFNLDYHFPEFNSLITRIEERVARHSDRILATLVLCIVGCGVQKTYNVIRGLQNQVEVDGAALTILMEQNDMLRQIFANSEREPFDPLRSDSSIFPSSHIAERAQP